MVTPLRVVYLGTPQFAVPTLRALLASRHSVCGVITQPDRPRGRGQQLSFAPVKALAIEQGLPLLQPERLRDDSVESTLRDWAPDLGVVAAYGKIIPEALIGVPTLGMINVHASLLPLFRGAAPIHRAVLAGHATTGVTIMRVVKALDAGSMFAKASRAIGPDETSEQVERDLAEMGAALLMSVVDQIAAGTAVETAQDDSHSTYAARLTKEEGLVDWARPAATIHNQVRGLWPWPHAWTYLNGRRLILLGTRVLAPADGTADTGPGTIAATTADGFAVTTGQGLLLVREVQPEGRRPMSARDFAVGHRLEIGARLTGPPADRTTGTP
ncbi:MAG: methionyl-tRNA formyltransferase [Vicinamibacterales bacterium]